MEEYLKKDFGKILKASGLEARRWMKNSDSDVCRVYDRSLEGLCLTVDIYGSYARVMDYGDEERSDDEITEILDTVSRFLYIERDKVIWKERKKREGREQHEKTDQECPVVVRENGLEFECELKKYADTGLFLDQAITRTLVRDMARNQRVLNLFCYTSSFSVYAASGGADSVESVDLSNVYASWSRRNLERNGFLDEEKYKVTVSDARTFLEKAVEEKRQYDIIVFDPPAFSNSHKAEDFDVQKDYIPFLAAIWRLLSDGGVVVFAENLSGFRFEKKKLDPWYEVKEITVEVSAMNFSKKKRSCRVWEMAKKPRKTKEYKRRGREEKREMDEEMKEMEAPERLVLEEEREERKTERRAKAAPRVFSFEDSEEKETEERPRERREFSSRRDEGRGGRRFDDRRDSRRDDRRDDRRGERRFEERRNDRRSDDRRDSRYGERRFEERRSERRFDDRRSERHFDDRRDSHRDDRRDFRRDERRFDDRRDNRRDEGRYSDRYSSERRDDSRFQSRGFGREERRYDRYASDSRTFSGRRDSEGRRDNYKRDSFPSRDRRYRGEEEWDNETSRVYRENRRDDRRFDDRRDSRRGDRDRKKSGPKPFGYDSFMENKNREGATAFWLAGQLTEDNDN